MRYQPIMQKPYCCVPACLSMILDRRGIPHGSQEEIGWDLGLTVHESEAYWFSKVRTGEKPPSGFGTQVQKDEYSIGRYFQTHNIPLEFAYLHPDDIGDAEDFVSGNIRLDNDIMACFAYITIDNEFSSGHAVLVEGINDGKLAFLNPMLATHHEKSLDELIYRMRFHGRERMGGFWVIADTNPKDI